MYSRDHGEHDLDVAGNTRPQDRAQLSLENIAVFETKPDRATTQKRIELISGFDRSRRNLVSAKVERPNDQRIRMHLLRHSLISVELFLLGWQCFAVQIKKFRAIKPNPLRAVRRHTIYLLGQFDVRGKNNVSAVARGRFGFP